MIWAVPAICLLSAGLVCSQAGTGGRHHRGSLDEIMGVGVASVPLLPPDQLVIFDPAAGPAGLR